MTSGVRVGFLGAGRVARTLALGLHEAGYALTAAWSRTPARAHAVAASAPACRVSPDPQGVADACELVFVTVSDDVIQRVTESVQWRAGVTVAHCSGARDLGVLAAASSAGAVVASLHPLQTFTEPRATLAALRGATFTLEGDSELLEGVAHALGGKLLRLPPGSRALYHASGTYASPFVLALLGEAVTLWKRLGFSERDALDALIPLMRATLANAERDGLGAALTGPVARGDTGTVARHLQALRERAPEQLAFYARTAALTVPLAQARGLPPEQAAAFRALLDDQASEE